MTTKGTTGDAAARDLVRRRAEHHHDPGRVPWAVIDALSRDQALLLLSDPALVHTVTTLASDWSGPPASCFGAAVDALDTDLKALAEVASRVAELMAQPLPLTVLDAALDAVVIEGAPVAWALAHAVARNRPPD